MNWAIVLKTAAGVSSLLSLAAFLVALYFWREAARKYPSIRELIGDERVSERQMVRILREFKDEHRVQALGLLLGESRAHQLLDKVKGDLDPIALEVTRNQTYAQRFTTLLLALVIIAALSVFAERQLFTRNESQIPASKTEDPIQTIGAQIDYQNVENNQNAIASLVGMGSLAAAQPERDAIVSILKKKLQHPSDVDFDDPSRAIRKALLEGIVKIRNHDLRTDFLDGRLSQMDLVNIDFGDVNAQGVNFTGAFLLGSDFRRTDLRGADLSSTDLRGVHFDDAQLRGAVFSNADWFNALGLKVEQLSQASEGSVSPCPPDFIAYANTHYGVPYTGWTLDEQRDAERFWTQYRRAGNLCDWAKRVHG
jgi:hypothetical protein